MSSYAFPKDKLKTSLEDGSKTPLVLVAAGAFSPITYLHLRMFEMVADFLRTTEYELIGCYLSPVADAYKKSGLAPSEHRLRMCELAARPAPLLMVDPWEAKRAGYTVTAVVLDHIDEEVNHRLGGVAMPSGARKQARIALMAGADLMATMITPGVWSDVDLDHILGRYGAWVVERYGTDSEEVLEGLARWRANIHIVPQLIPNDVSSTRIRSLLAKGMSIRYLTPDPIVEYIRENGLYQDSDKMPKAAMISTTTNS